jgi:hypothetical protein
MKNARHHNKAEPSALDSIDFTPSLPRPATKAWLALVDLTRNPLTQIDWLMMGRGWRLAAAFKKLADLGWPLESEWVFVTASASRIKRYRLKPEGLHLALTALNGVK